MDSTPPRLGMNYVPSDGWWYSWVDWHPLSIRADLVAIADLGADHIRIHILWPLFQPNASMISETMLSHLQELFELAEQTGLDIIVTVFNGWLSGFDFRPAWIPGDASIFSDRHVVQAELDLLTAVASRIAAHPRFLGFDIANEPSVLADNIRNVVSREDGDAWVDKLLTHCEAIAPGGLHSVGMDHIPWLQDDSPFTRSVLARTGTLTPIHSWVYFTGAIDRYGAAGTGTIHLAEFMLELAKAYSADPARQVWLQEYGASTEWGIDPASFLIATTRAAFSVNETWGVTWWCSHDIARDLQGFAELEYELGLLTVNNEVKPAGAAFRAIAQSLRDTPWQPAPTRTCALVLDDERTPDLDFADAFFALLDQGVKPAIVLRSQTQIPEILSARRINLVIEPLEVATPPVL